MKTVSDAKDARHAEALRNLKELLRICDEQGTAVDGMTKKDAIARLRRLRDGVWKAKQALEGGQRPSQADRARALADLRELRRICRKEGTAIDGMTKEQAIAHMRRVRERLWKAHHAYRPGHE